MTIPQLVGVIVHALLGSQVEATIRVCPIQPTFIFTEYNKEFAEDREQLAVDVYHLSGERTTEWEVDVDTVLGEAKSHKTESVRMAGTDMFVPDKRCHMSAS